jgi:hypothetical protein
MKAGSVNSGNHTSTVSMAKKNVPSTDLKKTLFFEAYNWRIMNYKERCFLTL